MASPPIKLAGVTEILAAVVTIAGTVLGWHRLDTTLLKALACLGVLSLVLVVGRIDALRSAAGGLNRSMLLDPALAAALVGSLAALATILVYDGNPTSVPPKPTPSSTPLPASGVLAFSRLATNSVPRCNVYQGTGSIPIGSDLLVFDRAVDENNKANGGSYYYDGQASSFDDGWKTPRLDAGAEFVEIAAVLVVGSWSEFFGSITVVDEKQQRIDGAWLSGRLPPSDQKPISIVVKPDLAGTKPC